MKTEKHDFAASLVKFLGLEGRMIKSLDLHVSYGEIPTITTTEYVGNDFNETEEKYYFLEKQTSK